MAEFKPMVKMFTDEPSVILKLKKGGKVKGQAADHGHHGHKAMAHVAAGHMHGAHKAFESEHGKAPKKPSMAERRRAMNPQQYAKGGKVAHKALGGGMMGVAPAAQAMPTPMGRPALMGMTPAQRAARAAMLRRAITGMKKGGHAGLEKHVEKLEKELHHHESMPMSKAHKADGGAIDKAETRTTLKNSVKPFAKTKMDTSHRDTAHGTGEVKEGKPGGYAMGGTIEGNEGPFENTKMVSAGRGKTNGTTGGVRMSNAGGFKKGGKAVKKASGGAIDAKLTRTTVEGGNWENRPANSAKPGVKNTKTGEVKEANAGGYKHGGKASKKAYATGGNVVDDGKAVKMPRHFVSLPVANSLQSGTFKRGGKVKKADGGSAGLERLEDPRFSEMKKDKEINESRMRQYISAYPDSSTAKRYREQLANPNYSETAVSKAIASSNRSGRKIGGKEAKAIHRLLKDRKSTRLNSSH